MDQFSQYNPAMPMGMNQPYGLQDDMASPLSAPVTPFPSMYPPNSSPLSMQPQSMSGAQYSYAGGGSSRGGGPSSGSRIGGGGGGNNYRPPSYTPPINLPPSGGGMGGGPRPIGGGPRPGSTFGGGNRMPGGGPRPGSTFGGGNIGTNRTPFGGSNYGRSNIPGGNRSVLNDIFNRSPGQQPHRMSTPSMFNPARPDHGGREAPRYQKPESSGDSPLSDIMNSDNIDKALLVTSILGSLFGNSEPGEQSMLYKDEPNILANPNAIHDPNAGLKAPLQRVLAPFQGDVFRAGEAPEHQFFREYSQGGRYYQGEEGGQDDNINARVSPGEYVWDADAVSLLGDGNNAAGAKKLKMAIEKLRSQKRKANEKSIPPKASPLSSYLSDRRVG